MSDITQTVVNEATKAAPVVGVNVAEIFGGIELNTAVQVATLIYLGLQVAYLIWKWLKERKGSKNE